MKTIITCVILFMSLAIMVLGTDFEGFHGIEDVEFLQSSRERRQEKVKQSTILFVLPRIRDNMETTTNLAQQIQGILNDFQGANAKVVSSNKIVVNIPPEFKEQVDSIRKTINANVEVEHTEIKPKYSIM
jgi:hypothetical protein